MRLHSFTQHGNIVRDVEFLIPKHMDRQTDNWRNEKNHRSTAAWTSTSLFNLYCFEALEHVFLHTSCIHHWWRSQLWSWTLWVPSPVSGQLFTKHTGDIWSWWKIKKRVSMPAVRLLVKALSEVSDHLFLVSLLEHILQLRRKTRLKKWNDKTKVTEACTQWSGTICWDLLLSIPMRSCDCHTLKVHCTVTAAVLET